MNTFSIKVIIRSAWRAFTEYWGILWAILAVTACFNIMFGLAGEVVRESGYVAIVVVQLASVVVSALLQLGATRITLGIVRGKEVRISQLFGESVLLWRYLGASIVYGLIVIGGLILLIVPGIVWAIKYAYYPFAILERGLDIKGSLKYSATITEGAKWQIFKFGIVFILLFIASVIPIGLGLIATIPMSMVTSALIYQVLADHHEAPNAATGTGEEVPAEPVSGGESAREQATPFVPLGE